MKRVDIYDPQWLDMVFAGRNQAYGAYVIRKETSSRNIKSLGILFLAAAIAGGIIAYNVHQKQIEASRIYDNIVEVHMPMTVKKDEPKTVKPKPIKKEIPEVRQTQKFVAPIIKPDELVNEKNMLKQMDMIDAKVAVGTADVQGTNDRTAIAMKEEVAAVAPPAPVTNTVDLNKEYKIVEVMPSFPGGPSALMSYLASHVKYPVAAQEQGIQGRTTVSFVVERDGSITDVKTVRSSDPMLDREAERVVKSMPRWTPGKQNGTAVRVRYNVPVSFRLQ